MIEPANYQMVCPNNATFEFHAVWAIDGTPVDMTGAQAAMQVRPTYSSSTVLIDLIEGSGIIVDGAGNIDITVDEAVTAAVPPGNYVYDLVITISDTAYRLLQGKWQHLSGVTR
ncbi:MAG: hypothetical protein ACR2IJ_07625 [Fluviibacter sp.]